MPLWWGWDEKGPPSRLAAVVAPRRMQVADRAEKFWPHNEEANLDNVQEERVFPLLSLGSTHPSTFSNTEDRRWWCSQTRLPLTWPGSRLGCSSVLLAASACCKVYPNFRRLLSRAAIPWHPTLTVALCVQPFLHFCPWLRPSFWETSFFRKITVQLILGENMKTFKVYLILWYVAALPLAILNKPPCLLYLFFHEWPSRQANPSSDGQTHTYPDGWL